jgi:triacylglycerol lipase
VLAFDLRLLDRLQRWGLGSLMSTDCTSGDCARVSWEQLRAPTHEGFAFTSIYSQRDGIVDWHACLDPDAIQVEVSCSHVGMAVDRVAYRRVVEGLTRISAAGAKRVVKRRRPARQATAG